MAFDPDKGKRRLRVLRKSLRSMPKRPSPQKVHELRTATRRVEAVVRAFMSAHKQEGKLLLRAVTPIRKKAGNTRDLDVFIGLSATISAASEKECLVQLIEHLGSRHVKSVRKLRNTISKHEKVARARLKRCSVVIGTHSSNAQKQSKQNRGWSADATAAAIEVWSELTDFPRLNLSNLHPFRIKAKELRYILQLANDDGKFVRSLGEVKDAIGEWHDWNELAAIAARALTHGSKCPVVKQIRSIAKQKFGHALSTANKFRTNYQDESFD